MSCYNKHKMAIIKSAEENQTVDLIGCLMHPPMPALVIAYLLIDLESAEPLFVS